MVVKIKRGANRKWHNTTPYLDNDFGDVEITGCLKSTELLMYCKISDSIF